MAGRRPSAIPAGSWPPRMRAEMAAGYVGEKHVEDFLDRVGKEYPAPRVVETMRRKFWYRQDLDKAMNLVDEQPIEKPSSDLGDKFIAGMARRREEREAEKARKKEAREKAEALKAERRQRGKQASP